MSKGKFKKVIYFEHKIIILRDDKTRMILNFIPIFISILNCLFPLIQKICKINISNIIIVQVILILILVIYSCIHINNLCRANHFYDIYNTNEDNIKKLSDINHDYFISLNNLNEKKINEKIINIKNKIKKIRPEDDFKLIVYLKILLDVDDYALLEFIQQKFYHFGYGDETSYELDMFNTSELSKDEYRSAILNLFVNIDLKHYYDIDDLKDKCKNYLLLFYTEI